MNTLLITDLHAHNWPIGGRTPEGRNARFQDLLSILDQIGALAKASDLVIFGGDLLHRRHYIPFSLYNVLAEHVVALATRAGAAVLVTGNHDLEDSTTSSLEVFNYIGGIRTVTGRPQAWPVVAQGFTAIPYQDDASAMINAFQQADSRLPIVAHYAASGCLLESDYWLKSPIDLALLERFPRVLFGHVHKPSVQCPACGHQEAILDGEQPSINMCPQCFRDNPVVYLGAPLHFDFGDKGPRFVWRWEGTKLRGIRTVFPAFITAKYPRIPRPASPGYLRLLDVPVLLDEDVKQSARKLGWLDVITVPSALPPEVSAAITSGLIVGEGLLRDYVRRRASDLSPEEQDALVTEGLEILAEARR